MFVCMCMLVKCLCLCVYVSEVSVFVCIWHASEMSMLVYVFK